MKYVISKCQLGKRPLNTVISGVFLLLWHLYAAADTQLTQGLLDRIGRELVVTYEIKNNLDVKNCQKDIGSQQCYLGEIRLTFPESFDNSHWQIYFGITSPIGWDGSREFDIKHTNGDLHTITPIKGKIIAGHSYIIPFKGGGAYVAESEALPNYFIAGTGKNKGLEARIIQSTVPKIDPDTQLMFYPHVKPFLTDKQRKHNFKDLSPIATPEYLYQYHAKINALADKIELQPFRIIPNSKKAQFESTRIGLNNGLNISISEQNTFSAAFARLEKKGIVLTTTKEKQAIKLRLILDPLFLLGRQGYQLTIQSDKIQIKAKTNAGLFYGLISLAQLVNESDLSVPVGVVSDTPRYDFRGVHLDVARNFHSKAFVLSLLEQMAALKLNKFHFHLAEDEGWRLEIPDLPELTDVGAYRCFDLSEQNCLLPQLGNGPSKDSVVNGYFSTEDYIEILKFANARHIEVIPSLDMPGHSRAAVKAMEVRYNKYMARNLPQQAKDYMLTELADKSQYRSIQHYNDNTLNPCIDSTYHFVGKILNEIMKLHEIAGVPLQRYHIGADETAGAWQESPACKQLISQNPNLNIAEDLTTYFIERVARMVNDKAIIPGAWGDGLSHADSDRLPAKIQANIWGLLPSQGHNRAHQFANRNWQTILSLPDVYYFDFPYQAHPKEQGNDWGTRSVDSFKAFQFMPDNLPVHAEIWQDSMGRGYTATDKITLNKESHFYGIQAQLWSETTLSDNAAGYMLFPRLISFAERAWHKPNWAVPYLAGREYSPSSEYFSKEKQQQQLIDWAGFSRALVNNILPALAKDKMFFRLPTPGAKIENGMLYANRMFAGLTIQYRQLDSQDENNQAWQDYYQPVAVKGTIELRSQMLGLSRTSRIIKVK